MLHAPSSAFGPKRVLELLFPHHPSWPSPQGEALFTLSDDGTSLHYKLIVANIQNVTQSHIHRAPFGVNGGIVVWLYPSAPPAQLIPGRSQGILAEGVITDAQVIGSLAGTGVAGLLAEIRAGNTYDSCLARFAGR
ncbi:MAG TPA: CHRD domain-containing protein [Longimicrobiales bacterium]|nr:CHRD domain-containing protein [Longimicrobiales bacterium]